MAVARIGDNHVKANAQGPHAVQFLQSDRRLGALLHSGFGHSGATAAPRVLEPLFWQEQQHFSF